MDQTPQPARQARLGILQVAIALALVAFALFILTAIRYRHLRPARKAPAPTMRIVRFTSLPWGSMGPNDARLSPDGNQVAYSWDLAERGNWDIYVQTLGNDKPLRLTTDPAMDTNPVWSPDGRYVAFRRHYARENGIYVVPASGGPERKLLTSNRKDFDASPDDWSPDGKFLAYSGSKPPGIRLLALDNPKESRPLIAPSKPGWDYFPRFSPDGQTVAFVRDAEHGIVVVRTAGGQPKRVTPEDTPVGGLDWTPDGAYIVFLSYRQGEGTRLLKISASGGQPEPLSLPRRVYEGLSLARHGRRLSFTQHEENANIWRYEVLPTAAQSGPPTKLIASTGLNFSPQFSPDGKRVAFLSTRSGSPEVWLCDSGGSNPRRLTFFDDPDGQMSTPRWSPEGREIVFTKGAAVNVVSAEGGQPRRVATGASGVAYPSWSRNGKWIYFGSENERDGTWQVWKVPAEGGHEVQVTKRYGFAALESLDGKTLYYVKNMGPPGFLKNGGLWKVPVEGGEETLVFGELGAGESEAWDLTGEGIYFYHANSIEFYNFATRKITQVAKPEIPESPRGLAVSPDGRWILLTQMDIDTSHIMLIENFRW